MSDPRLDIALDDPREGAGAAPLLAAALLMAPAGAASALLAGAGWWAALAAYSGVGTAGVLLVAALAGSLVRLPRLAPRRSRIGSPQLAYALAVPTVRRARR